jgi:hypothetical protein
MSLNPINSFRQILIDRQSTLLFGALRVWFCDNDGLPSLMNYDFKSPHFLIDRRYRAWRQDSIAGALRALERLVQTAKLSKFIRC